MNRLSREKSPYLRQHAGNPVDWYPWGDEAFERARREDKPVFLSIGYSTCHWCHVMERESFADEEVARLLNGTFVCVNVDREERPDLDDYFMSVGQALTGAGGWPLTVVMTPDKRPFFAGTYFPKERRWGRPGLMELIPRIGEAWRTRRDVILRSADGFIEAVRGVQSRAAGQASGRPELAPTVLDRAFHDLEADFDAERGGFGSSPKFPIPHHLEFLLRYWRRTGNGAALAMAEGTLQAMRRGGIWDHLGSGFHRYSTDSAWLVPHFEKMLYDQALLAGVYAEAFLATGKPEYKGTAADTLEYVLRDLTSPEGGFYSAEDADSEGEEGRFYIWTDEEVRQALNDQEARLAIDVFSVRPEGNFAEPGGRPDGRNILHLDRTGGLGNLSEAIRRELFMAREKRVRPFKDTKILADWTGLAISAFARAARATGEARFLKTAERATRFVLEKMRGPGGRMFHAFMEGEASVPAFLDDYAFLVRGLIELYQAGFDPGYLESALEFAGTALADFADREDGGFFAVPAGSELPVRTKAFYDGTLPSGNSVMLMNLLRLARLTGRRDLEEAAGRVAASFADRAGLDPRAHTGFLNGLDYAFGPTTEIVVVGRADDGGAKALLESVHRVYLPNAVVLFKPVGKGASRIEKIAPFTKDMREVDGAAAAYVCAGGRCLKPVVTAEGLDRILRTGGA